MDWLPILKKIAPAGHPAILDALAACMPNVCVVADLSTKQRVALFLGQIAEESDAFRTTKEYASGAAYENRHDLGNTQKGDGMRFKGRGLIELTGRGNYSVYGPLMGVDLVSHPELAEQFPYAALSGALFWRDHKLNALADRDDVTGITKKINGGTNGLATRKLYTARAKAALAATPIVSVEAPLVPPPAPILPHPNAAARAPAPTPVKPPGFWGSLFTLLFHQRSA